MIEVWYADSDSIDACQFDKMIKEFSMPMALDIMRYRNFNDRKCRLLARKLIWLYRERRGFCTGNFELQAGPGKKPFLPGGPHFNISHSGHCVVVAFSDRQIGVDVEKEADIDVPALSAYYHPFEIQYLQARQYDVTAFYRIWVRKEAYLKAVGTGITEGLDSVNILPGTVKKEGVDWYIHDLQISPGYPAALCSPYPEKIKEVKKINWNLIANGL